MRILHLTQHLSKGGAERQLSYLAPKLAKMGHQIDLAYLLAGSNRPTLDNVTEHQLTTPNNHNPFLLWKLIRLIRVLKPDIIHTWILQMDILGGMAAEFCQIPWILREPSSSMAYSATWKQQARVMVASRANAIVSNSQGGDGYWKTQLPNSRRYIIHNGLPMDKIERATAILPPDLIHAERPIILYVGRLIDSKNLKTFLDVLAVVSQHHNILGILCGEGPQQDELLDYKNALGLDANVHFAGYLPATSVWTLTKKATVFVSLSLFEGQPNTVMEAMACGCPLVLSDIPAHREIANEHCASFVAPNHIQHIAECLIKTLNDQETTKERALRAKQKSQKWSIDEMARNYERVYEDVLSYSVPGIAKKNFLFQFFRRNP